MEKIRRLTIKVYGIVQGVGFRPFIRNLAYDMGINGTVCNRGPYVEIKAESGERQLAAFLHMVENHPPERASVVKMETFEEQALGETGFLILESEQDTGWVLVSPDIAICEKCKKEMFDPKDQRYLHPFINCTACGPRLTILDSMPYDRERTSMGKFPMCDFCRGEYENPRSRRFHAQPVCCPECGPEVRLLTPPLKGDAIERTRNVIRNGGIAAVKGIGGFHLCCDATDPVAVSRLRRLKNRPFKPFAVMARNMEAAGRECETGQNAARYLDGPEKPIVLLAKKAGGKVCEEAAPGNPKLGMLLPYAPLQLLLFDYPDGKDFTDCLIMTSGNRSGAPICRTDEDALDQLSDLCDLILTHNREIRMRADDSVLMLRGNRPYMVRRSRGYAPLPVTCPVRVKKPLLAVGGELKNAFCLVTEDQYYLSPHIGDLGDPRAVETLGGTVDRMSKLLGLKPEAVACDLHPGYRSVEYARQTGLPLVPVQHHFAHVVSCMAENGIQDGESVIGAAFDGTGYGTDGTIWGGEFLKASFSGFERMGSIRPFALAGGDRAAREGYRPAVSLLLQAYNGDAEKVGRIVSRLSLCEEPQLSAQIGMIRNRFNSVMTTSVGRLFDAVAAILGVKRFSTFEGEAASALEYASAESADGFRFRPVVEQEKLFVLQTGDVIQYITESILEEKSPALLARQFHEAAAAMVAAGCVECRKRTGINTVALSGGVFQNLLLLRLCENMLGEQGFRVLTHSMVPANDGGIALGQAVAAAAGFGR